MDKKQISAGIGSAISFTFGVGLQVSGYQNAYLAGACFAVAALLALYLVWLHFPWLMPVARWMARLRLEESDFVSLRDAAIQALEAIDGSALSIAARRESMAPNGALCFMAARLYLDGVPLHGKRVPSTRLGPLPDSVLFDADFADDATTIRDNYTHKVVYCDVAIKRCDLDSAILKLKARHPTS